MYSFEIPVQDLQLKEKAKEDPRVMSHYNSLLREAVMSPCFGRTWLHKVPSNLFYL